MQRVFFADWTSWRVAIDLFLTAFFGGIYAVPLNAIMQTRASPPKRSRVIAANNVINAICMIAATVTSVILLQFITARGFFLCLGLANAGGRYLELPYPSPGSIGEFCPSAVSVFFSV